MVRLGCPSWGRLVSKSVQVQFVPWGCFVEVTARRRACDADQCLWRGLVVADTPPWAIGEYSAYRVGGPQPGQTEGWGAPSPCGAAGGERSRWGSRNT